MATRVSSPPSSPRSGATPLAAFPPWLLAFFGVLTAAYAFLFIRNPSPFFADDSFFYLEVGRNFALGYGSTFNRLMPTNGYHPIWMLLCALLYKFVPGRVAGLHGIATLIVALNIAVLTMTARLLARLQAPAWIAWTILIPFLFGLQLGTESSISATMLAATLLALWHFMERPDWRSALAFNLFAAFAVLSRLDSIFVIACLWIGVLVWAARLRERQPAALRLHLAGIPIYAVLWGAYIASNLYWFGIFMPISGLLKSHNASDHRFGHNLPHTALLALAICALSLLVLWRKRHDRWFWYAELPFFAGVLLHAGYITLHMTSETRWTWYYTSWALLAALTGSRAFAALLGGDNRAALPHTTGWLRPVAIAGAVLLSAVLFWRTGLRHSQKPTAEFATIPAMRTALGQAGMQRVLAYDQPGAMAYFTRLAVVPLDGLMADRAFQRELSTQGIGEFVARDRIQGFVGPPVPFGQWGYDTYCGHLFLESTKYFCEPWRPDAKGQPQWMIDGVEVYSRLPLAPAGRIALPPASIVWTGKDYVTVWRIAPGAARADFGNRTPASESK